MGSFLCFSAFGVVCLVIQSTVFAPLGLGGVRIDLMLIVITYIALYHPLIAGSFLSVFLGYLFDLNSASPFGLHMLTFLSCFLGLTLIRNRLFIHGPAFCVGLTSCMVVAHDVLIYFFLSSRGEGGWPPFSTVFLIVPKALLTGAFWPFVTPALTALDRFFPHPYTVRVQGAKLEFKY